MLKIIEIGHGKNFRCCRENERGDRFTTNFKYEYSKEDGFRSFTYNDTYYEYDEFTNRYYFLSESCNLRPEMDGALVRRRIGKSAYMEVYRQLLEYLGLNEERKKEASEETETAGTTEPCSECETIAEPKQNEIPQEVKDVFEEVIRPAANALYVKAGEPAKSLSAFTESCMIIKNARPPP